MSDGSSLPELVIGVLGGMGPQASADFLLKLIAATSVEAEQEHLRVLLDVNPKVPDRNQAIRDGVPLGSAHGPGPVLAAMAAGLEQAGATMLVMACNTAHAFEPDIRRAINIPFVSMVEEACDRLGVLQVPSREPIGVLAAQGCIDASLYQKALERRGRRVLLLDDAQQHHFMQLVYRIKRGDLSDDVRRQMRSAAQALIDKGAGAIIVGCTEVPLVLDPSDVDCRMIDATDHLAARCVRYARRQEPLPAHCSPG